MKKYRMSNALLVFLLLFFLLTVIYPIGKMFIAIGSVDVFSILRSDRFLQGCVNSFSVSFVSTVISVIFGYLLSFCIYRVNIPYNSLWRSIFSIPMLIPSISIGTGLVIILGRNGIITRLLGVETILYGFGGIVLGSVMYSFPIAFIMISDILKSEDYTPYEAARVLNINKFHSFFSITLPYIRKPMISVFFAVFSMIITDYGVPLMIGGTFTTLPVIMYQDVIGMLDFGKGSVIAIVLLIPALIAFLFDLMNKDSASTSFSRKRFPLKENAIAKSISLASCIIASIFILFPIIAFILLSFAKNYPINLSFTFKNIAKAFEMRAGKYLGNSLVIALSVAMIGTLMAFTSAYISVRQKIKGKAFLHLFSILTLAVPGIVLGLSFSLAFNQSFFYGTLSILILVNILHFFSSPYLLMYNALGKINPFLESVGYTLGIKRLRLICNVIIPMSKNTIIEMFSYFFVNSMMTISAVAFLSNSRIQPISLMIPSMEGQMMMECIGVVSLIILLVNQIAKAIFHYAKKVL